uniref:Uncharacterized protein n=1 Tax=Florenciella sp. virus SA2 TaxID=3240092 RepID=A0AB39JEA3_9VIRU
MSYGSDKIDRFKTALDNYVTNKSVYDNNMNYYKDVFNTLKNMDNSIENKLYNSDDTYYILINDCILKEVDKYEINCNDSISATITLNNGIIYDITGSSDGSSDKSCLYLGKIENGKEVTCSDITGINKIQRVGLTEYDLSNTVLGNDVLETTSKVTPDITTNAECSKEDVYRCHNYAQLSGSNNYGLYSTIDESSNCNCVTNVSDYGLAEPYSTVNINKFGKGSYLMTLMDGRPYILNSQNYSDNFNELYTVNDEKTVLIDDTIMSLDDERCNAFAGSGITDINVSLDELKSRCINLANNSSE